MFGKNLKGNSRDSLKVNMAMSFAWTLKIRGFIIGPALLVLQINLPRHLFARHLRPQVKTALLLRSELWKPRFPALLVSQVKV